jgi:phage-related protein
LSTAKQKISSAIETIGNFFKELPGKIEGFLKELPGKVWNIIKTTVEKAAYLFGFGLGLLVRAAIELPQKIAAALIKLPGLVWGIIKTVATKGAQAFASFVTAVVGKAIDLASQVPAKVSAMVAAVVGFLRGLPAKAVAAIRALPGLLKAAVSDAGTWLLAAGKAVVQGAIDGIKGMVGSAISVVKDLGGQIASGFAAAIGFNSPAKRFIPMGSGIVEGVEVGIKSRAPAVYNLLESFAQRIGNIKVTAGVKHHIEKLVTDTAEDMRAVTSKLDRVTQQIKDQQAKIADLVKAKADYANQLAQGISGGGITNIGLTTQTTDAEGNTTDLTPQQQADAFLESMKVRTRAIHAFNDNMDALKAKGLSQDVLQQIAQSGLETGGALAASLVEATPETLAGIDGLSQQIQASSQRFGDEWSGEMYDNGLNASKGMLEGFQSKHDELIKAARDTANEMSKEIKKVLKIKSPSAVMRDEVGAQIAAGLAAGIRGGAGGVASAMRSLVAVPSVGARIGLGGSIAGAGGAGVTNVHLHVPNGFVGSPDQLATALSDVISRAKARGLNLSFA